MPGYYAGSSGLIIGECSREAVLALLHEPP